MSVDEYALACTKRGLWGSSCRVLWASSTNALNRPSLLPPIGRQEMPIAIESGDTFDDEQIV